MSRFDSSFLYFCVSRSFVLLHCVIKLIWANFWFETKEPCGREAKLPPFLCTFNDRRVAKNVSRRVNSNIYHFKANLGQKRPPFAQERNARSLPPSFSTFLVCKDESTSFFPGLGENISSLASLSKLQWSCDFGKLWTEWITCDIHVKRIRHNMWIFTCTNT